jgi:hypothetical protein
LNYNKKKWLRSNQQIEIQKYLNFIVTKTIINYTLLSFNQILNYHRRKNNKKIRNYTWYFALDQMVLLIVSPRWSIFFWHNQCGPFNMSFLWSMIRFSSLQPILLMTNLCVFLQNFGIFFTNTSHCICRLCVFVIIEPNRNRARTSDTLTPPKSQQIVLLLLHSYMGYSTSLLVAWVMIIIHIVEGLQTVLWNHSLWEATISQP